MVYQIDSLLLINKLHIIFSLFVLLSGCTFPIGHPTVSKDEFQVHRALNYSHEGMEGDLYVPNSETIFPAVLLIHPGSWSGGSRDRMNGIATQLVNNNFVVFNISYRFAPDNIYPAQLDDCIQAIKWMRQNAARFKINPSKIGVYGFSAGGYLAAQLATTQTDPFLKVQAVVAGSAPLDLTKAPDSPAVVELLGTTIRQDPMLFKLASPFYNVSADDPPMFLYHGRDDSTVDISHSVDMAKMLDQQGVKNQLYIVENYGHIPLFIFANSPVRNAIDFLRVYLRD